MMDSKVYAALGSFSNLEKDDFKKWSSQFEDVANGTYGAQGRTWLVNARAKTQSRRSGK